MLIMRNFVKLLSLLFLVTACSTAPFKITYHLKATDPAPIKKNINVALVLGGGGARAIAQLGVLEVLEENNIPVDLIVGTSGGSIIGALYADNPKVSEIKDIALQFKRGNVVSISLRDAIYGTSSLKGTFDGRVGEKFLEKTLTAKEFDKLKIPFIAVATDIVSGETIGLRSGKIAPAVRASYSIPGLFSPVEMYGMILVDGGVTAPLAVDIAKYYKPKVIIAVDVSLPRQKDNVKNMIELVHRAANLTYYSLSELNGKQADFLIKPHLEGIGLFDDHRNQEIYLAGKVAALEQISKIKDKLKQIEETNNSFKLPFPKKWINKNIKKDNSMGS